MLVNAVLYLQQMLTTLKFDSEENESHEKMGNVESGRVFLLFYGF